MGSKCMVDICTGFVVERYVAGGDDGVAVVDNAGYDRPVESSRAER